MKTTSIINCKNESKYRKLIQVLLVLFTTTAVNSQVYNVSYGTIDFGDTGVTITSKVGDGTNEGDVVLYENILTVSGQQIDAFITTIEISNGTITTYDYTGTSQNNQKRWFSPQATFNSGGGYLKYRITFIEGGSYSDATNTGNNITLADVVLNSYDIDGNGNANSNQYCDFGGFSNSEIGNPTNLEYSYNSLSGLTRFRSTTNVNNTNAAAEENRVKLSFTYISSMDIILGGEGDGAAYYFLDFSGGDTFVSSTQVDAPVLDLDTETIGADHDSLFVGDPASFTYGSTNIIYSGLLLDELSISFDNAMILDGAQEKIKIFGDVLYTIPLNFTDGQAISDIVVGGVGVAVTVSVVDMVSSISFTKSGGGQLSLAETEALLDVINYDDDLEDPTVSDRNFEVSVRDGEFQSNIAVFTVIFSTELPAELVDFSVDIEDKEVVLRWITASEYDCSYFEVERSKDLVTWTVSGKCSATGNTTELHSYSIIDYQAPDGKLYYRLKQFDMDGNCVLSEVLSLNNNIDQIKLLSGNNGKAVKIAIPPKWRGKVMLSDLSGKSYCFENISGEQTAYIILNQFNLSSGVIIVRCESSNGNLDLLQGLY